jgi:transcriptional/translational regulatory protein YebC/TACO1
MPRAGQTTVHFNQKYFDQIMKTAAVDSMVKEKAEEALKIAKATAPVDTEDYKNGLKIEKAIHKYRDTYLGVGTDAKSLLVEAQTGNLARAIRAVKKR